MIGHHLPWDDRTQRMVADAYHFGIISCQPRTETENYFRRHWQWQARQNAPEPAMALFRPAGPAAKPASKATACGSSRTRSGILAARAEYEVRSCVRSLAPYFVLARGCGSANASRIALGPLQFFPAIAAARMLEVLSRMIRGSTCRPSTRHLRTSLPEMKTGFSSGWLSIRSTRPSDS